MDRRGPTYSNLLLSFQFSQFSESSSDSVELTGQPAVLRRVEGGLCQRPHELFTHLDPRRQGRQLPTTCPAENLSPYLRIETTNPIRSDLLSSPFGRAYWLPSNIQKSSFEIVEDVSK